MQRRQKQGMRSKKKKAQKEAEAPRLATRAKENKSDRCSLRMRRADANEAPQEKRLRKEKKKKKTDVALKPTGLSSGTGTERAKENCGCVHAGQIDENRRAKRGEAREKESRRWTMHRELDWEKS